MRPKLARACYKGTRIDTTSCFYRKVGLHANNQGLNSFSTRLHFTPEGHHHSVTKTLSTAIAIDSKLIIGPGSSLCTDTSLFLFNLLHRKLSFLAFKF